MCPSSTVPMSKAGTQAKQNLKAIEPLVNWTDLQSHILKFLNMNPHGVRNADVARAIGFSDKGQYFAFNALERLINDGLVHKTDNSLYFKA